MAAHNRSGATKMTDKENQQGKDPAGEFEIVKPIGSFKIRFPSPEKRGDDFITPFSFKFKEGEWRKGGHYSDGIFRFRNFSVNGKRIDGMRVDDEKQKDEINRFVEMLKERRNRLKDEVAMRIVNGEIPIRIGIVGCDWPHYQPWVNVDDHFNAQDIMKRAINHILKANSLDTTTANPCDYLERVIGRSVKTDDEMPDYAFEIEHDPERLRYHGYNDTVVTNFKAKLKDIMKVRINNIHKREDQEAEHFQKILKIAQETNKPQKLRSWSEDCDGSTDECDIDNIIVFVNPDGTTKTERIHTY